MVDGEASDMLRKIDKGGVIPDGWLYTLHQQGLIEYRQGGWRVTKKGKEAIK